MGWLYSLVIMSFYYDSMFCNIVGYVYLEFNLDFVEGIIKI